MPSASTKMALTREQLDALAAPQGWRFLVRPTLRTAGYVALDPAHGLSSIAGAQERLTRLHTWAKENALGLKVQVQTLSGLQRGDVRFQAVSTGYFDLYFPVCFKVTANAPETTEHTLGEYTCFCGHSRNSYLNPACHDCGRHYCSGCRVGFVKLHKVTTGNGAAMYCTSCSIKCKKKGCAGRMLEGGECTICNPQITCALCLTVRSAKGALDVTDQATQDRLRLRWERQWGSRGRYLEMKVCESCAKQHYCKVCKKHDFDQPLNGGECALCADKKIEAERAALEVLPDDWIPQGGTMVIPSVAFRPFRTISYEMELDGDGPLIARALYRCGLVPISRVAEYSRHPDTKADYPCFLKHDSSCGAGELIAYLLNLDDPGHAEALLDTCKKVHSLSKLGKASHGPTCGGHIHVDAHNFNYGDVWRLVTGFGYIEDPFFRIAGAGADYGHRSLDPSSRARNGGEGYTNSPVKGPFGNKGVLGRSIAGQKRNHALNFTPWLGAASACECGAMAYEDSKNCKCHLGKATIEFRVFNSTHNPRILHAWIALVQALMAWSEGDTDPSSTWENDYPALSWTGMRFNALLPEQKAVVKERVEWMFRELPLTEAERDSLAYTVSQTDMDFGPDWPDELRAIIPTNAFPEKKPARNPARRQRKLKIAVPTPGAPEGPVGDGRDQAPRARNPFRPGTVEAQAWTREQRRLRERLSTVTSRLQFLDEEAVLSAPSDGVAGQ